MPPTPLRTPLGLPQTLVEEVPDALLHVHAVLQPPGHVALVGEQHQIVRARAANQGVDQPGRVAEVHVFVDQAVDEQQAALECLPTCAITLLAR